MIASQRPRQSRPQPNRFKRRHANKYQRWTNDKVPEKVEDWIAGASENPGSWSPYWDKWLSKLSGKMVPARTPGDHKLKVIEASPGTYAKMK